MPKFKRQMMSTASKSIKRQVALEEDNWLKTTGIKKNEKKPDKNTHVNPHRDLDSALARTDPETRGRLEARQNPTYIAASRTGASEKRSLVEGENQDRIYVGKVNLSGIRSDDQIPEILYDTNNILGEECIRIEKEAKNKNRSDEEENDRSSGSTLTACIIYKNQVVVSNVGDSRAVLILRNKATGEFVLQRLTVTHKPGDEEEKKRIEASGAKSVIVGSKNMLTSPYGSNSVAVSRSFGDEGIEGLIYEPSIATPITVDKKKEAYVILYSDGISDVLLDKDILKIFKDEYQKSLNGIVNLDAIAEEIHGIAEANDNEDSGDNKSIIITPVNQPNLNKDEGLLVEIIDGHLLKHPHKMGQEGQNRIAGALMEQFAPTLQTRINTPSRNLEFIDEVKEYIEQLKKSTWGQNLRDDKIAILELFVKIVKEVNPPFGCLPELIKRVCSLKITDLINGSDCKFTFKGLDGENIDKNVQLKTHLNKQYGENYTIKDVLSERRILSFFKASKPLSQQLIEKYSKPTEEEQYGFMDKFKFENNEFQPIEDGKAEVDTSCKL